MDSKLQFIFSTGEKTSSDAKTRKAVRVNAMRSFRRNERLQRMRAIQPNQDEAQNKDANSHTHEPAGLNKANFQDPRVYGNSQSLMLQRIGTGIELDPFLTTILHTQYDADRLFTHCTYSHFSFPYIMESCHRFDPMP
jgi:hypothetical protein